MLEGRGRLASGAPASAVPTSPATRPVSAATPTIAQPHVPPLLGTTAGGTFGTAVSAAGDLDGDGIGDLMVGAPFDNGVSVPRAGRVHFYSGATRARIHLPTPVAGWNMDDEFGRSVDMISDLDADGVKDFIVGAPQLHIQGATGYAQVRSGSTGAIIFAPTPPPNLTAGSGFGHSVAAVGDVNKDGKEDFAVGAPYAWNNGGWNSGVVQVYSGATGLAFPSGRFTGFGSDFFLGWDIDAAGDVNGDTHPDVIIGAYGAGGGRGLVQVLSGYWITNGFGSATLFWKYGTNATDGFASCVAGVGDVNLDGFDDVLIGTNSASYALVVAGQATSTSSPTVLHSLVDITSTSSPGVNYGISVAGGGDVNGDGIPDFLVGGGSTPAGTRSVVRCYSGATGTIIRSVRGPLGGQMFGLSCALVGDWTGNGAPEIVVGAPLHGTPPAGAVFLFFN